MKIANIEKPHWYFYSGWVVLNILAVVMAWFITWGLMALIISLVGDRIQVGGQSHITEDFLFFDLLFPVIGLLTGFLQYLLLRRYLSHMTWWIAATLLGWLTPFVVGSLVINLLGMNNSTVSIMTGLLMIGAVIAVSQWWVLRRQVRYAYWWIPAYGIGWGLAGLFSLVTSEPFPILLVIACLPAAASGFACWLLLDRLPGREIQSSSAG
jgi:hypothetical protein